MAYLKLFHGRKDPNQDMDDWGEPGPVFGPFPFFQTTYGSEIKFERDYEYNGDSVPDCRLKIVDGMVYYDGMYYGDWSVFDGPPEGVEERGRHVPYNQEKAELPN